MKDYISKRVITLAEYIIEEQSTVRGAAKKFGISKSTVHKDITERLLKINPQVFSEAKKVLENNKKQRHIRGGMATKLKYQNEKKQQKQRHTI